MLLKSGSAKTSWFHYAVFPAPSARAEKVDGGTGDAVMVTP